MLPKALFLDRDGTINVDHGYVCRVEDFDFIDGVFRFCRRAQELGYLIIIITNQSGIARGYYSEADYAHLTRHMLTAFASHGIRVHDVLHCPELDGPNRKPNPGLFLQAQQRYGLDMAASLSIGDKPRDVEAGVRAGCGRNILFTGDWDALLPELEA